MVTRIVDGQLSGAAQGTGERAWAVLTFGAFLTLLLEASDTAEPVAAVVLGAMFAILAIAGFGWPDRQRGRRRLVLAVGRDKAALASPRESAGHVGLHPNGGPS